MALASCQKVVPINRIKKLGFIDVVEEIEGYDFPIKLQYMVIAALSIGDSKDSREFKLPIYEGWETLLADFKENKAPEGLKNVYQVASFYWAWMESERAFFVNAIGGMVISICFACVVILLATRNWIITLYAIHCVGFICASEMALQHLVGMEMGVAESIGTIMVIGFSVDYVVHLAAHYVHSAAITRFPRTTESLGEMGISIFSGAMTTIGSASFLLGGTMNIFKKFGFILTTTCAIALVFSLVYFTALSHGFGPEGSTGNLGRILRICIKKHKGDKSRKRVHHTHKPIVIDV